MNLPSVVKSLAVAALGSVALLAAAVAQEQDTAGAAPVAGKATLGVTVAETDLIATGWRASKLVHAPVYNENNEKIGRIDDFIVSPDGTLSVAIIDVGGFLGVGAHRVAIPVQQFDQVSPKILLKGATKDALLKMPEFKYAG
ncbi:MAG TPA: PRC-barrel domain-containing protein [Burkholderiaceae bacterium]|jgi:sporulation protein YlmC with PRC-barrel domain|nr:PRC-barrel domain-containing protein [Burkholderiaceae bacterium]